MKLNENFFSWTLIYSLGVWVTFWVLDNIELPDYILPPITAGVILLLISLIAQKLIYHHQIVLDRYFILWFFIHSILFWVLSSLLSLIEFIDIFIYFITFGLCYNLVTYLIKYKIVERIRVTMFKTFVLGFAVLFLLYDYTSIIGVFNSDNRKSYDESSSPITEKITEVYDNAQETLASYSKEESKKAFDYINQLRKENGVPEIPWDDKIYELGLYKVKDMSKRNYFDHIDPDGNCIGSYASDFGMNYPADSFAENLFGGGTAMDAVNTWMGSRGHRYNLLFDGHVRGVIACDSGNCAFIGQGGSNWVCDTGENGLAYWDSVGRQPGEK